MRTCKGNLLLEGMICIIIMGILMSISSVQSPRVFSGSREESPVILMGLLNEEMRDSASSMKFNQIRSDSQVLTQQSGIQVKKRSRIAEKVRIFYGSTFDPWFTTTTSHGFLIRGLSAQSGKVSFYRNGKVECIIMIHVGTLTMEVRGP